MCRKKYMFASYLVSQLRHYIKRLSKKHRNNTNKNSFIDSYLKRREFTAFTFCHPIIVKSMLFRLDTPSQYPFFYFLQNHVLGKNEDHISIRKCFKIVISQSKLLVILVSF